MNMIDFQSDFAQHYSTIEPIFNRLKKLGYEVRNQSRITDDKSELTICSYDSIVRANPGYTRYVMHHHGLEPTKGAYPHESIGHINYNAQLKAKLHLLASDWWKEKFLALKFSEEKLKVVGYPKLDPLFTSFEKLEAIARSKIKTELPILLYAPTWFGERINQNKSYNVLAEIAKRNSFFLLTKPHETSNSKFDPKEKVFLLKKDENIVNFYPIADILITDCSSTAYEFSILDRPIIQITESLEPHYLTDISLHSSLENLEANIKRSFDNPKENSSNRSKWAKRIMILDGNSTERATDEVIKCLEKL